MKRNIWLSIMLVLLPWIPLAVGCAPQRDDENAIGADRTDSLGVAPALEFGDDANVFVSSNSLPSILSQQISRSWTPGVNPERWHGGIEVFEKIAPATVVVRAANGHGTGFIISEDGLVLTNHHVVAQGTSVDVVEVASFCMVHLGSLTEQGRMELVEEPIRAFIIAIDPARDLALLQLDAVPNAWKPLPTVPFASANPRPGQTCLIVGHPSSGMLWTLRQGSIAGIGEIPRDLVNVLLPMLASTRADRAQIEAMLDSSISRDIVLSTCLANPGDSGGPLLDEAGDLIGVTFGIPSAAAEQKFTYHVALNEVLDFLDQAERARRVLVPEAWRVGPMFEFLDPRVLTGGVDHPAQLLLDLDGDTPRQLIEDGDFAELVGRRRFDAEVILHYDFGPTAFYDTDNDGTIDEILVYSDQSDVADLRFLLEPDGEWRVEFDARVPWLDPSLLEDRPLRRALERIAQEFELS